MRGSMASPQSSLRTKCVGRGTARRAVEGLSRPRSPSTMLRMVPFPIRFADGED